MADRPQEGNPEHDDRPIHDIHALRGGRAIEVLEAEAEIRRLQARYMFLCDTPCPEFGVRDDEHRIDLTMELYAADAVWEGVGDHYTDQFGRAEGAAAIRAHFEGFWGRSDQSLLLANAVDVRAHSAAVRGGRRPARRSREPHRGWPTALA